MLLNNKKNNKCLLTTMDKIKIIISGFPILLTNKILALRDLQMNLLAIIQVILQRIQGHRSLVIGCNTLTPTGGY